MSTRTPDEVYASLLAAGWPTQGALTMTAIAGAESGWNDTALGDTQLEDTTWGPSYGLFQIRTVKAQTGTGSTRDINTLAAGDVQQAAAALAVYQSQGLDAWTVYQTGAYRQYLAQAQAAAARAGGGSGGDGPAPTIGPTWLPWNWPSDLVNAGASAADNVAGTVLTGARHIAIEALAVVAGLGLVVAGLYRLGVPNPVTAWTRSGAKLAGKATGLGGGS